MERAGGYILNGGGGKLLGDLQRDEEGAQLKMGTGHKKAVDQIIPNAIVQGQPVSLSSETAAEAAAAAWR